MKLIAEKLAVDRGDRRVFSDLTFTLESGSALVVTGANGVGKSSLLRTLAGLVALKEGGISLEGGEDDRTAFEHSHYFGHQDAVKPALTVLENLSFWQAFTAPISSGVFPTETHEPAEALEFLGIGHTARLPAAYLSAGQKRRLSLARLLVSSRPIWLMDEPTSALDRHSEAQLLGLMNAHLDRGGMIVTATHTDLALKSIRTLHLEAPQDVQVVEELA